MVTGLSQSGLLYTADRLVTVLLLVYDNIDTGGTESATQYYNYV